jgi:hypothetical protein
MSSHLVACSGPLHVRGVDYLINYILTHESKKLMHELVLITCDVYIRHIERKILMLIWVVVKVEEEIHKLRRCDQIGLIESCNCTLSFKLLN